MTALDAIAAWLRDYQGQGADKRARNVAAILGMAAEHNAPGLGALTRQVANVTSVVLSLARVSGAQADALRGLADENAALRARVEKLDASAAAAPKRDIFGGFPFGGP